MRRFLIFLSENFLHDPGIWLWINTKTQLDDFNIPAGAHR